MAAKRNQANGSDGKAKKSPQMVQSQSDAHTIGRVITTKDAGWVSAAGFVAPLTFVPIDAPRPLKKRRRR